MYRTTLMILLLTLSPLSFGAVESAEAVDRMAEAIRYRTISYQNPEQVDYAEFRRHQAFLERSFPRVFSSLRVELINDHSILIVWEGSDAAISPVLFTAHVDVVPIEPGTESDWAHPPFDGVVADGNIYGRGTLDDKQGVMGWLEAAESLLSEGFRPSRTLVFAFGHDEEIGGRNGAKAIAERMEELGLRFSWMIDEGGLIVSDNPLVPDRPVAMVNIAEKAYVTLTLTASGEGGHSSSPPKISTIGRLSAALTRIENNPYPPRLSAPVEAMLEAVAPHAAQPQRFIFSNLWLTGGLVASTMAEDRLSSSFVRSTTALTMFNAGVKENVVPQTAQAKVNFRLLPGDTPEALVERITGIIDDPEIKIDTGTWNNVPGIADPAAEGFRMIEEAIGEVYPEALTVPSMLTATTDTRHYVNLVDNQYRFHGVLMDSSQASSIHGTGEYVSVDSYLKSIEIARAILRSAGADEAAQ